MSWMQRLSLIRVVTRSLASRPDPSSIVRPLSNHQITASCGILPRRNHDFRSSAEAFSTATVLDEQGFIARRWQRFKFVVSRKYALRPLGWLLYRDSVDQLDYMGFFQEFKMADTYYSWFLVTELHVWMLMVKLMNDGVEGIETRKNIVEAMWDDADMRKKQLGPLKESIVRDHMIVIGQQFNAAIMGYDEGLLTNDKVLAGAVWRRFLQSECNDPEMIEKLVVYIRKTMIMLDKLSFDEVISKRNVKWLNYKNLLQH